MKVFRSLNQFERGTRTVATIGTFDGVHLGHQQILNRLIRHARENNGESVVISFHPHPRLVLFPEDNPLRLIQTIEERIASMDRLGIDKLMLIPFTKEFSRLTSEEFISNILVGIIDIQHLIVGYDHQFGKNRTGGLKDLMEGGQKFGFSVEEIPPQQIDSANISSTKIRNAVQQGDIRTANRFLGYSFTISGKVIRGEQLGRQLGYPTANIQPDDPLKLIPAEGVYLCEAHWEGEQRYGMLNIGRKPTVGEFPLGLEVNLLDFEGDLYDKVLELHILEFIRPDRKFSSLDALVRAIDQDKADCLALIEKLNA